MFFRAIRGVCGVASRSLSTVPPQTPAAAGAVPTPLAASVGKLLPANSCLLLCDMQEAFRGTVAHFGAITSVAGRMLAAFRLLERPVIVTEQAPDKLGHTVPEVGSLEGLPVVAKTQFSMLVPEVNAEMTRMFTETEARTQFVLCGIEAHVCVAQTALDLRERDHDVFVVADAVSARGAPDRAVALAAMRAAGCHLTTSEAAILALCRDAAHPRFRQLQALVMDPAPDSGLLDIL